jgi:cytochrome c
MKRIVLVALFVAAGLGQACAQDAAAGEKVFAVCKACHQVGDTAKNAVGPVLNGLIGRKAGSVEGYNYSDANKKSGITWTEEEPPATFAPLGVARLQAWLTAMSA